MNVNLLLNKVIICRFKRVTLKDLISILPSLFLAFFFLSPKGAEGSFFPPLAAFPMVQSAGLRTIRATHLVGPRAKMAQVRPNVRQDDVFHRGWFGKTYWIDFKYVKNKKIQCVGMHKFTIPSNTGQQQKIFYINLFPTTRLE